MLIASFVFGVTVAAPTEKNDLVSMDSTEIDGIIKPTDDLIGVDDMAKGGSRPVYRPPIIRPPISGITPGKNVGSFNSWRTNLLILPFSILLLHCSEL